MEATGGSNDTISHGRSKQVSLTPSLARRFSPPEVPPNALNLRQTPHRMSQAPQAVEERAPEGLRSAIAENQPVLLPRGYAKDWPAVKQWGSGIAGVWRTVQGNNLAELWRWAG